MNYFSDVFTDVVLMEAFLMEFFFDTIAVSYFGDVFTDVVLMEAFLIELFFRHNLL